MGRTMNASVLVAPMSDNSVCDAWGNIRAAPVKTIEESHGDNFIKVFIYEAKGAFYFGYQIKVGKTIQQKSANINDRAFDTKDLARIYGCSEAQAACGSNKNTLKLFAEFKKIKNAQPELFAQED
jgi:hypothetical protein